jgi:putative aldouronate transport system substrate-binding protein
MIESWTRRRFLGAMSVAGGAGVLATACGGGKSSESSASGPTVGESAPTADTTAGPSGAGPTRSSADADAGLPKYTAATAVTPDLAPTEAGVCAGYLAYPKDPPQLIDTPPGHGGTVSGLTLTYDAAAPARSQNAYWQQLDKLLGVTLDLNSTPSADYSKRFATTIAGNDLPDLTLVTAPQPQLPAMVAAKFTDIAGFVTGTAVDDYPYLGAIPTDSWKVTRYNNGIFGVPIPRSIVGGVMYTRVDVLQKKGLTFTPKDHTEFFDLLKGLVDERDNTWAAGNYGTVFGFLLDMLAVPSGWSERDGQLVNAIELPEYQQALADTSALAKAGVFHPDAATAPNTQINEWLTAGTIAVNLAGYAGWYKYDALGAKVAGFDIDGMVPPGYSGGQPTHAAGNPSLGNGFLALKKTSDKGRITELLSILNWLNAPFGSAEYLARLFGVANTDYTLDDTDPALTARGKTETLLPIKYFSDSSSIVIYEPNNQDSVKKQHAWQEKIVPLVPPQPTLGLYSETEATKGSSLNQKMSSLQNDIFAGRKSASEWAAGVKEWKSTGGDAIRKEYETALAAGGS